MVTYEAIASSISLSAGDTLATPGLDFDNTSMTITIGDGEASGVIEAPIINVSHTCTCIGVYRS